MNSKKILIVVPAFNEEGSIGRVVCSVLELELPCDCVVVNDGSLDSTSECAREAGALILDLPSNLGIGGAVQTGFKFACRSEYDFVVQFDGDGQHIASEIPKLISCFDDGFDVIIGSRFVEKTDGFQSTKIRRIGIYVFELLNKMLIKTRVTDSTSGFRAYNRRAFQYLANNYPADYPEPEAVIELASKGFRLTEVSVLMNERESGESSISSWRSVYYMVKVVISMLMASWRMRK